MTTDTYYRRDFTCRCRTRKKGPTIATKQTRRTPTNGNTTLRNPKTTRESMAQQKHQEQKLIDRIPCFTIQ